MRIRWTALIIIIVGIVAFATRFFVMSRHGLASVGAYDDGVYFAGALSFVHGLVPYQDFLLLHPPGVMLVSAPFAWLAPAIGDAQAFIFARVFFIFIGAVNAMLIALLLRRYGPGAMLSGGLVYALSYPAIYGERSVLLEPFGTTFLLLSLLVLVRARRLLTEKRAGETVRRVGFWFVMVGALAALSVTFKIWYAPFVLVIIIFAGRGWWQALVGAVVAADVVLLPFLFRAPDAMWRDVVLAQLGRPGDVVQHFGVRIGQITGAKAGSVWVISQISPPVLLAIVLALGVLAGTVTLFLRGARIFVVFAVLAGLILLASPSFFQHYAVLTAMPLALMVGAMIGKFTQWAENASKRWWRIPVALAAATTVLISGVLLVRPMQRQKPEHDPAQLIATLHSLPGCYATDMPSMLILANRYTADLNKGCRIEVDPTGYGYVVPKPGNGLGRSDNPAFQRHFLAYLKRSDGYVFARGSSLGLDKPTQQIVDEHKQLAKDGKYIIISTK